MRQIGQIHLSHRQGAPFLFQIQQLLDLLCRRGSLDRSKFGQKDDSAETLLARHSV